MSSADQLRQPRLSRRPPICSARPRGLRRPISAPTCRKLSAAIAACWPSWSRRRRSSTRCSCGRSGRATRRCCSISSATTTPEGRRAAALLPDQQGTLVAARSQRAVRAGAPAKPAGANFYPPRRSEGGAREVDRSRCPTPSAPAPPGSSPSSAAAPAAASRSCPTASSIRTSWRDRGAAARGRGAGRRADAEGLPRRSAPTRSCRTTTTTATWRGWS